MKKSTVLTICIVVVVLIVAVYLTLTVGQPSASKPAATTPPPVTQNSGAPTVGAGEHCGGNIRNAPVCATGFHCAPAAGSHLPFGDVGGTCLPN